MPSVELIPDSRIGEWTFGEFRGRVERMPPLLPRWNKDWQCMEAAKPSHWRVFIEGTDRGWRDVLLPLRKGRTAKSAVREACALFESPNAIKPENGYFGKTIDLIPTENV